MLIRGGTVWSERGGEVADVRLRGGSVVEVGALQAQPGEEVVEASGLHVLPGMIDMHVHVDDVIGPFTLADTWATASRLALVNGITTLAGFVTQHPDESLAGAVERCRARAEGRAGTDVLFHLTPTCWPWPWDEVESLVARGYRTFKLYTTYREAGLYLEYDRIELVMHRLVALGGRVLVHCEDEDVLAAGSASSVRNAADYARARPERAETAAVERLIAACQATSCPLHVVHVSTAAAAERLSTARRAGAPVSFETAPQYLLLNEERLRGRYGHRYLCTPPLRAETTRAGLEHMLVAGEVDVLATDHCAFLAADKDVNASDARRVPTGLAGLGALVPTAFELLVRRRGQPLSALVRLLSAGPARSCGLYPIKGALLPGSDADLVLLEPDSRPRRVAASMADTYQPYPELVTTLAVDTVIRAGTRVVSGGGLVLGGASGRCLQRSPAIA